MLLEIESSNGIIVEFEKQVHLQKVVGAILGQFMPPSWKMINLQAASAIAR